MNQTSVFFILFIFCGVTKASEIKCPEYDSDLEGNTIMLSTGIPVEDCVITWIFLPNASFGHIAVSIQKKSVAA